jgi:hypothetical protein
MVRQFEINWADVLPIVWRATLLGVGLFFVLTSNPVQNLVLNLATFLVAVVWSFYDGLFGRRQVGRACIEGIFLYLGAIGIANLMTILFGNPLSTVIR